MRFARPDILWFLLLVPPMLAVFLVWAARKRKALMAKFIQPRLLPGLIAGVSPGRQTTRGAMLVIASVFLILALARPQWGFVWEEAKQRGIDIIVAIDTSKSMVAEDIPPNRLTRAKLAAFDLMELAKTDRLGLVAFAGSAFLQCPLTIDNSAFRQSVEALDVNVVSEGGTALAEAIRCATEAFKDRNNHAVLVLLTDGEDHDSDALEAAREASDRGVTIFTVGIGSVEGELLRIRKEDGSQDFVRDEAGNVVKSRLNESLLQQIASKTEDGFYQPLKGAKVMETIYKQGVAPLPKSESGEKLLKRYQERFHVPLSIAIMILIWEFFLPERKRMGKRSRKFVSTSPQAVASMILLFLLFGSWSSFAAASTALKNYREGEFEQALREYKELAERNPDDARLQFNTGAAAYRNGLFEEAERRFGKASSAQDLSLQQKAYYNRGNALFRLGEAEPDPRMKKEKWKQSLMEFERSLKLAPSDPDSQLNQEFVKRQLQELEEQQQQQQNQQQNGENEAGDKNEQSKSGQQNSQAGAEQQQQQQNQQNEQGESGQPQTQPGEKENPGAESQSHQQTPGEQKKNEREAAGKPQDQEKEEDDATGGNREEAETGSRQKPEATGEGKSSGGMTQEEARQILDMEKSQERMLPHKKKPSNPSRRFKDW